MTSLQELYAQDLLRTTSCYSNAAAACNIADMSAFYIEQKAYKDVIEHTKDLLTGGDGYHCWLSSNSQKQGRTKQQRTAGKEAVTCPTAAAAQSSTNMHHSSTKPASNHPAGHEAAQASPGIQPTSPPHHQGNKRVQGVTVATQSHIAKPAAGDKQFSVGHPSTCSIPQQGPVAATTAVESECITSGGHTNCCRTARNCQATNVDIFPDIAPLPGVPTGAAFLNSR